jgi:YD repeat-containing protein
MTAPSPANGASGAGTVTTRYAYDAHDRLCRVLQNASVDLATLADPCQTPVSGLATSDVSTRYDYTDTGLLWHQYAPAPAGTTTYQYDAQGHLVAQTDPDGYSTTWTYDAQGNKTTETDPDTSVGPTVSYAYDAAGRMCRRVAASPGVVLQNLTNPCTDTVTGATIDTRYSRDVDGNPTTIADALASQTVTSTYDQLDRPLTVSGDQTADPATSYSYDFDNPTRTDPSGSYGTTLDAYGRLVTLTDPLHTSGHLYTWTYAPSGAVSASSDPTGNTTTNTYDPLGRLTARSTTGGTGCTACAVYSFTYNNAGNQLTRVSTISGDTANGTTSFAYDALDRLTTYTPPTVIQPQSYTWNGLPDRARITIGTGTPLNVTFDAADRPVSDDAGGAYSADNEGRITAFPGKTLVYDAWVA